MFYLVELKKDLDLHPRFFGKQIDDTITNKLITEVEGTCNGKYGYVVSVAHVLRIGEGLIRQDSSGYATFRVTYQAVVCRPYKGEVLDCQITSVNKMGFFAEAGPLQIFVSNHLIPEEFEYSAVGDACYASQHDSNKIQEGAIVRLRIVGTKMDQAEIFCIGSIKEDYLGVIESGPV